jgi:drug/metabolite transporter (DMT)-like permease
MTPTAFAPVRISILGVLAVLFAAACWASSGIFVKLILVSAPVSSLLLAFWRDTAAFAVFLVLSLSGGPRTLKMKREDMPWLVGMGLSLGVFHVALNLSYILNGVSITTIQQAVMPAIVLVAARVVWKEPLTGIKLCSLVLIAIGTVLVSGLLRSDLPDVTASGILVGLLVPVLYAGWSLFGKALRTGYSATTTLTWAFGIAALILLPCQWIAGAILPPPVPAMTYLWFAGLIGVSTAAGFLAFIFALGRLPAGIATLLVMTEIVFAVVYAYAILGETLAAIEAAGGVLIMTGVALTVIRQNGGR